MAGGGIMQLIAFGAQDLYITSTSQNYANNSFNNYRPHTKKQKKAKVQEPLKEKKFKNFRKNDKYDQHKCVICLEKFKAEQFVTVRTCKHIYHKDCHHPNMVECPSCRQ